MAIPHILHSFLSSTEDAFAPLDFLGAMIYDTLARRYEMREIEMQTRKEKDGIQDVDR